MVSLRKAEKQEKRKRGKGREDREKKIKIDTAMYARRVESGT